MGKLAREGSKLPNPHLLIRPFITREAVLSSKIEGTHATIGEILAASAGISVQRNSDDLQEVQNYIIALGYAIKRLNDLPLSLRLIKEIHHHLMQGLRGSNATPGEFRLSQNWIGTPGCTLNTAKFVPPSPDDLMDCLGEFEKFLHERQLPALIHAAFCHYQFEAIHPFLDGNGRIGRLLIIYSSRLKSVNFGKAKDLLISLSQTRSYFNMKWFEIVKTRGFGAAKIPEFNLLEYIIVDRTKNVASSNLVFKCFF